MKTGNTKNRKFQRVSIPIPAAIPKAMEYLLSLKAFDLRRKYMVSVTVEIKDISKKY